VPLVRKEPEHGVPPQPSEMRARLVSGSREERWSAARALGSQPGDVGVLRAALQAEADPRVREAILTSLARVATAESVDAVLPHLRSDDAELRTGALDALRAMPQAVGPRMAELLADADPDVRLLVCELAREIPTPEMEARLCALIESDPEVNVCAAAIEVLAEVGTEAALPALARCAERFPSEGFLAFSIQVTAERITAQAPTARG
jgi:HEAT repeat protein